MADYNSSKDRRNIGIAIALILIAGLVALLIYKPFNTLENNQPQGEQSDVIDEDNDQDEAAALAAEEAAVRQVITTMGARLKNVSLLASNVNDLLRENFADLVTAELLAEWIEKPELAPGKLVSSPVPDEIEINTLRRQTNGTYLVDANIIERANTLNGSTTISSRAIALTLSDSSGKWLITALSLAPYDSADNWRSGEQNGIKFRYPENLGAKYISVQEWPPIITIEDSTDFMCPVTAVNSPTGDIVRNTSINGRDYCIRLHGEGAAGSTFNTYDYSTLAGGRVITASFTLRYPQCPNYEPAEAAVCAAERNSFDLDTLIDRIVRTIE